MRSIDEISRSFKNKHYIESTGKWFARMDAEAKPEQLRRQWASGFMMPIYNDNRRFLFYPEHRDAVEDALLALYCNRHLDVDVILAAGFCLSHRYRFVDVCCLRCNCIGDCRANHWVSGD